MGKTLLILKISLFIVNLVVAIIGLVMLGFTIKVTVDTSQFAADRYGTYEVILVWPYLVSFGVLGLSALGVYGTFTQKKTPLIVFCVLMGINTVILFTHAISTTVVYYKIKNSMRHPYQDPGPMFNTTVGIVYGVGALTALATVLSKLMVKQI